MIHKQTLFEPVVKDDNAQHITSFLLLHHRPLHRMLYCGDVHKGNCGKELQRDIDQAQCIKLSLSEMKLGNFAELQRQQKL